MQMTQFRLFKEEEINIEWINAMNEIN